MTPLRVVLCDDQEMVLEALTMAVEALGAEVVAVTTDRAQAPALVRLHEPDVCLLDAHFPDGSGTEVAARMQAETPGTAVVILTAEADPLVWEAYDDLTVSGIVNKSLDCSTLWAALQASSRGQRFVRGWSRRPNSPDGSPSTEPLTEREREVLAALVRGATTDEIAQQLCISAHTVRTHVRNVLRKLDVSSRAKAAQVAVARGLVDAA